MMNVLHRRKWVSGLFGVLIGAGVAPAHADGLYGGAGVGSFSFDGLDSSSLSFKLFGGYSFGDHFALEASYVNFGDSTQGSLSASGDAVTFAPVVVLPFAPSAVLFAKYGLNSWNIEACVSGIGCGSADDIDPYYGLGMEFNAGGANIRVEYEVFDDRVGDLWSVGFSSGF